MAKPHEGYEKRDVPPVAVAIIAFLIIVSVWVLLDACAVLFRHLRRSDRSRPRTEQSILNQRELPPLPRIQEEPRQDLEDYLRKEKLLLNSYGWVDRKAGVAHIPISRAMEIESNENP